MESSINKSKNITVAIASRRPSDLSETVTERKIQSATEGLTHDCFNLLHNKVLPTSIENAVTVCDYTSALRVEVNASDGYRKNVIFLLCNFSLFYKNAKPKLFKEATREDILSFLDCQRKIESVDPLHKWVGTYNLYRIHLMRFFKWLYFPDLDYKQRPKPGVIENNIN